MIALVKVYPVFWGYDAKYVEEHLERKVDAVRFLCLYPVVNGKHVLQLLVKHHDDRELDRILHAWGDSREVQMDTAINPDFLLWEKAYKELQATDCKENAQ